MAYNPVLVQNDNELLVQNGNDLLVQDSDAAPPSSRTNLVIEDGSFSKIKTYSAKFYAPNGNYISTEKNVSFNSFTKTINGGLGELRLTLARKFDDFGEGIDIDFMNEVRVVVVDKESGASGQTIYSGFIDSYEPFSEGEKEGVGVLCLGYSTRLSDVMYKSGTTVAFTHNATDPSVMIKDILDKHIAEDAKTKLTYTYGDTLNVTGESANYTFTLKSGLESLNVARKLSPADWYYYVDENNIFNFRNKPSQATHTFTYGKDISRIVVNKNVRDVVNRMVLWNGQTGGANLLRSYSDATSISDYGLRMEQRTDSRWGNAGTMDLQGNRFIAMRKDPNIRVILEIIDSNTNEKGYDIESINPGDTCKVLNLPATSSTLDSNMVISRVQYYLDRVVLDLEELRQTLSKKFTDVASEMKQFVYNSNDANTYTDV